MLPFSWFILFTNRNADVRQKLVDSNKTTLWQEKFVPAAQVRLQVEAGPTETPLLLCKTVLDLIEDHPEPAVPAQVEEAQKLGSTSGGVKKDKSKIISKWLKKK